MAIDNAEKRRSASQTLTGLFGPGVTPLASPDVEWRQQSGWGYSGIAPSAVVFEAVTPAKRLYAVNDELRIFAVADEDRAYTVH